MINQTTVFSDVFRAFLTLLNNHIVDPISSTRKTSKWIFSSYPDADIMEGVVKYPIIIIEPAEMSWDDFTLTRKWNMITVVIDVYSTSSEQADNLLQQINATIDQNLTNLRDSYMLRKIMLTNTDSNYIIHGGTKVHIRSATYTMRNAFTSGITKLEAKKIIASNAQVA